MTKCFLASGKVLISSEGIPVGWGKVEEFADWVFVAGMFSFPLPRFSWLDQSRNRRKGAHINWPCHPKWLWHFQECSSRSSSSFLAAFTLSHKRFLQQWTKKETNKSYGKTSNNHVTLQHFYSHHCLLLTNKWIFDCWWNSSSLM